MQTTPTAVRARGFRRPPQWLEVVGLKQPVDPALAHLDAGEREAISLASELQAILLLMDERDGVIIARHRGLKAVGTLAALDLAASHGLIDLQIMFDRLRATTFRSPLRLMSSSKMPSARNVEKDNGSLAKGQAESGYNKGTIRTDMRIFWYQQMSANTV